MPKASQWAVGGGKLQTLMSVIFSQGSSLQHIFLFLPYGPTRREPPLATAIPPIQDVLAGFHMFLIILELFSSSVPLAISKNGYPLLSLGCKFHEGLLHSCSLLYLRFQNRCLTYTMCIIIIQ